MYESNLMRPTAVLTILRFAITFFIRTFKRMNCMWMNLYSKTHSSVSIGVIFLNESVLKVIFQLFVRPAGSSDYFKSCPFRLHVFSFDNKLNRNSFHVRTMHHDESTKQPYILLHMLELINDT